MAGVEARISWAWTPTLLGAPRDILLDAAAALRYGAALN
jgi:hypothetical protein